LIRLILRAFCCCWILIGLQVVSHSQLYGQAIYEFSNQAALDLNTPQRFEPVVGLELGVIGLSRATPDAQNLVFDENLNVLLNSEQLQGDMGAGLDATFSLFNFFSDCKAFDIQMRYFQASDMLSQQTITANQVIPVFFNGVPANPTSSNDILYDSQIRSFELNLVGRTPYRIRLLAGFRFFEVDEVFDVIENTSSSQFQQIGFFSISENTMAGGQVGAEATIFTNRHSRVFGSFKWALLDNDVVGSAQASNASGAPLQVDARDSISSQLLDFQLGSSLSCSRWFSLYAGYQGLIASDIALALEQSRNGDLFSGSGSNPVFTSDTQWHGFKITGMATW
jgi:hypothetical protein